MLSEYRPNESQSFLRPTSSKTIASDAAEHIRKKLGDDLDEIRPYQESSNILNVDTGVHTHVPVESDVDSYVQPVPVGLMDNPDLVAMQADLARLRADTEKLRIENERAELQGELERLKRELQDELEEDERRRREEARRREEDERRRRQQEEDERRQREEDERRRRRHRQILLDRGRDRDVPVVGEGTSQLIPFDREGLDLIRGSQMLTGGVWHTYDKMVGDWTPTAEQKRMLADNDEEGIQYQIVIDKHEGRMHRIFYDQNAPHDRVRQIKNCGVLSATDPDRRQWSDSGCPWESLAENDRILPDELLQYITYRQLAGERAEREPGYRNQYRKYPHPYYPGWIDYPTMIQYEKLSGAAVDYDGYELNRSSDYGGRSSDYGRRSSDYGGRSDRPSDYGRRSDRPSDYEGRSSRDQWSSSFTDIFKSNRERPSDYGGKSSDYEGGSSDYGGRSSRDQWSSSFADVFKSNRERPSTDKWSSFLAPFKFNGKVYGLLGGGSNKKIKTRTKKIKRKKGGSKTVKRNGKKKR